MNGVTSVGGSLRRWTCAGEACDALWCVSHCDALVWHLSAVHFLLANGCGHRSVLLSLMVTLGQDSLRGVFHPDTGRPRLDLEEERIHRSGDEAVGECAVNCQVDENQIVSV